MLLFFWAYFVGSFHPNFLSCPFSRAEVKNKKQKNKQKNVVILLRWFYICQFSVYF